MTVNELIELLQDCDPDKEVTMQGYDIDEVDETEEGVDLL